MIPLPSHHVQVLDCRETEVSSVSLQGMLATPVYAHQSAKSSSHGHEVGQFPEPNGFGNDILRVDKNRFSVFLNRMAFVRNTIGPIPIAPQYEVWLRYSRWGVRSWSQEIMIPLTLCDPPHFTATGSSGPC